MKNLKYVFLSIVFFISTSFILIKPAENLIGSWKYSSYTSKKFELRKTNTLTENEGGFTFKGNGKLIARQNSSSCGTPPIQYGNFEGTWRRVSDSIITVKYPYWGGQIEQDWLILKLEQENMAVKIINDRTVGI